MNTRHCLTLATLILLIPGSLALRAEEGMWTFDNPPMKQLQDKYKFTPTAQWLDHVRLSSIRFNDGGSGSFVSANGLAITNHTAVSGQERNTPHPRTQHV